MSEKLTLKKFIRKARKIHGWKYDYSKVVYINAKTKVCIICPIHGEFWQTPDNHLTGNSCNLCGVVKRSVSSTFTDKQFIEKANKVHNYKYGYDDFIYNGNKTKGKIKCNTCQCVFEQIPSAHLRGQGCPNCRINKLKKLFILSRDEVIENFIKVHGNKYGYDDFIYNGAHKKSFITCFKHGNFLQNASNHLSGKGCPLCKESKGEILIASILDKYNIKKEREYKLPELVSNYEYDFYLPDYRILIEFHGIQHYEYIPFLHRYDEDNFLKQKERDILKKDYAYRFKYRLLEFNYKQLKYISAEQFEEILLNKINSSINLTVIKRK